MSYFSLSSPRAGIKERHSTSKVLVVVAATYRDKYTRLLQAGKQKESTAVAAALVQYKDVMQYPRRSRYVLIDFDLSKRVINRKKNRK